MRTRGLLPILMLIALPLPAVALLRPLAEVDPPADVNPPWEVEPAAEADPPARPIIRAGEVLTYRVHSSRFGDIGSAVMRVDEDTARARRAYRLSFTFTGRVMLFRVTDETTSWVDMETLTSLRYSKRERTPLGSRDETVDLIPELGTWTDRTGTYPVASAAPLDELAFIYFVRGLPTTFEELSLTRHFDLARNPVVFQRLASETVPGPDGPVQAMVIEMHVPDTRQKKGRSTLRFYISEDAYRLPLRIDSSMPMGGTMTLTLQTVDVGR